MDLKEEKILQETIKAHWYYQAKAEALCQYLGNKKFNSILDIGAGSGFFSRHLLSKGYAEKATCVDINYRNEYSESTENRTIEFKKNITDSDAELVLMMDVMEHVDNDVDFLKEYSGKISKGSYILVTVPAFSFLWSGHDVYLGHKRRYSKSLLLKSVNSSGLKIINTSYFFGLIFPLVYLSCKLDGLRQSSPQSNLRQHNPLINKLLQWLCYCELPFLKLNRVAGLSIFCLAQKQ